MDGATPTAAGNADAALDPADQGHPSGRWAIVPSASQAVFSVRDKLVTTVRGVLPVTDGRVAFADGGVVADAWISLAVDGIATGNHHRDRHLQQPQLLDAAAWPSIRVECLPTSADPTRCRAAAIVVARGRRAPVVLDIEVVAPTPGRAGSEVRIRVTGRLDRTPLGIRMPTFVIGRFLDLDADLTLRRCPVAGVSGEEAAGR